MTLADNHFHTRYSDGNNTLREMVETALSLGYKKITVTDHVNVRSDWIPGYIKEGRELKKEYAGRIDISIGVEAKITGPDGSIDFDPQYRDGIDWVLAAVHRIPAGAGKYIRRSELNDENAAAAFSLFRTSSLNALENPLVDIIAHPFDLSGNPFLRKHWDESFAAGLREASIKNNKYIEYNAGKSNACVHPGYWQYKGMRVWIGSDSHSAEDMRRRYPEIARITSYIGC